MDLIITNMSEARSKDCFNMSYVHLEMLKDVWRHA